MFLCGVLEGCLDGKDGWDGWDGDGREEVSVAILRTVHTIQR